MQRLTNGLGAAFAGAAAVMLILAVLLPFYLIYKIDYAPTLVSNAIIERTPPNNAIALQNALGALSFPFALLGGIMIVGMAGMVTGVVYAALRRVNPLLGIVVGSLALLGTLWLCFPGHMTAPGLAPLALAGLVTHLIARRGFAAPLPQVQSGITRRELLTRVSIFSVGGLLLAFIDGFPVYLAAVNATKPGARLFAFSFPPARKAEFPAPGGLPEVTPDGSFYQMRKFPTVVPPAPPDFALVIDGLVDHPLKLTMADLFALPRHDAYITRQCVSNPVGGSLISAAWFSGVRLREVLTSAGLQPGAIQLRFYGRDGYEESVAVDYALENGLIAYAMNGLALADAHGQPLKMEIPGLYGFKNMKWLTRIEAIPTAFKSVWAKEGWTETARYQTMSRVDAVTPTPGGTVTICGVAFAGTRGISGVEVQVNGRDWQAATLHTPPLSPQMWVQWRLDVPDRGALTIRVRAVDGMGTPQIAAKRTQFPDGATGYHEVTIN